MRRREFIAGLGGAAAWPVALRAQPAERVRRIGVLVSGDENDPVYKSRVSAFTQALAGLDWTDGRNVRMDFRWAGGDINRMRVLAQDLVGQQPDIIVTNGSLVSRFVTSPVVAGAADTDVPSAPPIPAINSRRFIR